MRRILTLTAFVLAALSVTGQRTPEELLTQGYAEVDYITLAGEAGADTMLVTQPMPQYPGGVDGLRRDYFGHMQYPAKARERGIQGTFLVTFQIRTDGSVSQVNTIEHKGRIDPLLKQAALDALQYMKPWHPGFIDGEAVAVNVLIPVSFTLR